MPRVSTASVRQSLVRRVRRGLHLLGWSRSREPVRRTRRGGKAIEVRRLHVGCGTEILEGWCNVDIQDLPGVDVVVDVTREFPFRDIEYIFSEHFIEHLGFEAAVRFLQDCLRSLRPGGVLRLTTPNLDWVWSTHYSLNAGGEEKHRQTYMLNRAFYAWGHRFLFSPQLLESLLRAVGFAQVCRQTYGESSHADLRGIERHQEYGGSPELPDLLVYEAVKAEGQPPPAEPTLDELLASAQTEFLGHLQWRLDG